MQTIQNVCNGSENVINNGLIDNTIITDGTLAYTIGDNHVTYNVNERGQIDMPFNDNMDNHMDLHVVYDTDNSNYSVFEKKVLCFDQNL